MAEGRSKTAGGVSECSRSSLDDCDCLLVLSPPQPRLKTKYLLDYVCEQLDVVEKDYFGLRYVDHRKQRKWLDFSKSIVNQVRGTSPCLFLLLLLLFLYICSTLTVAHSTLS